MKRTTRYFLLFAALVSISIVNARDSKLFHEIYGIYGDAELSTRAENKELSTDQLKEKLKERAIMMAEAKGKMRSLLSELYSRELTTEDQDLLLVYLKLFGGLEDFIVWEKIESDQKKINSLNYQSEDWLYFAQRRTTGKLLPHEPITEYMLKDSEELELRKSDIRLSDLSYAKLSDSDKEILECALENGLKAIIIHRRFQELIESNQSEQDNPITRP